MNRLLIYIDEGQKFDLKSLVSVVCAMPGISNPREGDFGDIFECEYEAMGTRTTIRIGSDAQTVTAEGVGDDSVKFMLELQSRLSVDLYVTDMGYDFDLPVKSFSSIEEFNRAAAAGLRLCPWD